MECVYRKENLPQINWLEKIHNIFSSDLVGKGETEKY